MAGVFICYRREDAPGHAGRIFDRLRARLGADVVFMDVTAIEAGVDFVEAIERAVGSCDVLLAVIGPEWATCVDKAGRRRLESPTDFIRLEIAGALKRNVRIIPVLVQDAELPAAEDLPDDLKPLLRRNAVSLRDARWDADVDELVTSLERIVRPAAATTGSTAPPAAPQKSRRLRAVVAVTVAIVAVVTAALLGPSVYRAMRGGSIQSADLGQPTAPSPAVPRGEGGAAAPVTPSPTQGPAVLPRESAPTQPTGSVDAGASAQASRPPVPPARGAAAARVPNLVGRPLSEARLALHDAHVDLAQTTFVEASAEPDIVIQQATVAGSQSGVPAVALTVAARATVSVSHRPADADVATRIAALVRSSRGTPGLAVRTTSTPVARPDTLGHVAYSDAALERDAQILAKDVSVWLEREYGRRVPMTAANVRAVARRAIVIDLPPAAAAASSGSLPNVIGMDLAEAKRVLVNAGVTNLDYRWVTDYRAAPNVVLSANELPARQPGDRAVTLSIAARATLFIVHLEADSKDAQALARELRASPVMNGLALQLQPVSRHQDNVVGKVWYLAGDPGADNAAEIARFASASLSRLRRRGVRIEASADVGGKQRQLYLGLPPGGTSQRRSSAPDRP